MSYRSPESGPGTIRVLYEGQCATCSNAQVAFSFSKRYAEQYLRSEGWKKTKDGWKCPECVKT